MRLTFLSADRPLAKSYSLNPDGTLKKESYPHVWEFTSHDEEVSDLQGFFDQLVAHASVGHCLLKGTAQRPLFAESRAGSTDSNEPTQWICLDFDRLAPNETIEGALNNLGLGTVSRIIQYSASYGVETGRGATGHVFIMLDKPLHPGALKQWLTDLNLTTHSLAHLITLTKTNNSLSWPLDVTTCQADKLLYIAPPVIGAGVTSTFEGDRIKIEFLAQPCLVVDRMNIPTAEANRVASVARLDQLRAGASLPKRSWTYKTTKDGEEVLSKPDAATLTGYRQGRGFMYFNLNGGDSWGYYHPLDDPSVIRNFKGEPPYLTSELLPEYWEQLQRKKKAAARADKEEILNPGTAAGKSILALRDFRTATYWNGWWDPETQKLDLARAASETQIQHFLKENGKPEIEYIPTWNLVFDPKNPVRVDAEARTINTFEPSPFMKLEKPATIPTFAEFPTIYKLLHHALGNDDAITEHFLNWWACIYQYRDRTMTAWVLQGVQGTGKGVLVNRVLTPLLGASAVTVKRMQELEEQYNGYLENSLLMVVDEAEISESRKSRMLMANLKNMITEPQVSVRKMHTNAYSVPNFCNFMFLSNSPGPVVIETSDRRHNVGNFQEKMLATGKTFMEDIESELTAFAHYTAMRPADRTVARTVIKTAERQQMIATSTNSLDATSQALLAGNLEFFWDSLPSGDIGGLNPETMILQDAYERILRRALNCEGVDKLSREEVHVLFAYNVGDIPRTPAKFTSMLRHHRVHVHPMRINGVVSRGVEVNWIKEPSWVTERQAELAGKAASKVVPIRSAG